MNVANLNAVLTLDASGFNNAVNVAITQINNIKNAAVNTRNALQDMVTLGRNISGLGRELSMAVTVPIVGIGKAAIETTARFDRLKSALTAITGSASEAEKQFARLNEIAKQPGIGIEEAIQGSINLQAVGMSAEKAERAVKAFGNALVYSGRTKNELSEVETILSKIAGREMLSERQFTSLTIRIPKMRALLKEAFGTGDIEKIQKSGLPIDQILERFIYAAEQIPHVTGGIQNDIDNFQDNIKRSLDNIGQAMIPLVHKFTTEFGPAIENASKWFKSLTTAQKENIIFWGGVAAAIGPALWGFGQMIQALARIKMLIEWINASKFVTSGIGGGLGLAATVVGGAAVVANYANEVKDRREGKGDVDNWDVINRLPETIADMIVQGTSKGQSRVYTKEDEGSGAAEYAQAIADYRAHQKERSPKPGGYGNLPDPKIAADEQRTINRARMQSELEAARARLDSDSKTPAQDALKNLQRLMGAQATDLRKEAEDMHISKKSTAKEWVDYYRIQREASQLDSQILAMQKAANKEQNQAAKAARAARYQISELGFQGQESDATARGGQAAEGFTAQSTLANMIPVLKGRQAQIVKMWQMASADTSDANEAAVRRAQLEKEYWDINRKGVELEKDAAQERKRNEKKAQDDRREAFAAYRQFQHERIRTMAEEAPDNLQAQTLLNAELPVLRAEQKEIMDRQKEFAPNSKEYWDNARNYWQVEDQIHNLAKNAVKERHSAAQKAIEAQKQAANEQRELISLETRLMEARLKNNPLLTDQQRTQMMIPMLIRQYRQMMIPVSGETPIEAMRRMLEAEGMKHDIMQQAGALSRNSMHRVLGGGAISTGLNRRQLMNIMGQLDAPMSKQEQDSYTNPQKRAEQLAREYSLGRPVVLQFSVSNNPEDIGREVRQVLDNLNRGAMPFSVRR